MKVKAINSVNCGISIKSENPHLSPGKIYCVVGFDDENFRVVNDIGEPILYPKDLFEVIESEFPTSWVWVDYEDGEYHVNPPELSSPGFYEDYFDGDAKAIEKFREYLLSHTD